MNNTLLKKILAPIASLRLTVTLLVLSMVVILAGTTAQEHMGIWQVQEKYFHSWGAWIDLQLLFPLVQTRIPGAIPMLGGYTLIVLLLANLLSAHALRFKVSPWDIVLVPLLAFSLAILWVWQNNQNVLMLVLGCLALTAFAVGAFVVHKKRGGVILIHLGLILLLVGEIVTSLVAVETRMRIDEGSSKDYAYDIREPELVLADQSSPNQDQVFAIDDGKLRQGAVITDPQLPAGLQVTVDRYYGNSDLVKVGSPAAKDAPAVTSAVLSQKRPRVPIAAVSRPDFTGAGDEASQVDLPSAYVTLSKAGQAIGTYVVSVALDPQPVTIDGKPFTLSLRFRRHYLPFRLELKDFRFDRYLGTNTPSNYSAHVRLVDPAHNEDREVTISMNNPLRYGGLTFFQASFDPSETTTELQVVRNAGWLIPYISCVVGAVGLVAHFGMVLFGFLRKRTRTLTARDFVVAVLRGRILWLLANADALDAPASKKVRGSEGAYTLQPRRNVGATIFAAVIAVIAIGYAFSVMTRPAPKAEPFDLASFGKLPLVYGGRPQPLDSIARNHLKVISGKETFKDAQGKTQPAIRWLTDLFVDKDKDYRVFRIDHSDIKSILAQYLPPPSPGDQAVADRKLFSGRELGAAITALQKQMTLADSVAPRDRNLFQRKIMDLGEQMNVAFKLQQIGAFHVVPPTAQGGEWQALGAAVEAAGGAEATTGAAGSFIQILRAYAQNDPATFNQEVLRHRALVEQAIPDVVSKTDFETRFNRGSPFVAAIYLYVFVFLLAVGSWLGFSGPLRRAAFVLLLITLAFHTLALIWRMYLSGRPPVTNLYSSAIFIAWGTAVFALLLEMVFRNGIGSVTAAVTAAPSLIIAHYLSFSGSGDTMEVLQAVLDTNFWLATHVVIITLGYAATFLAGFLGIVLIVARLIPPLTGALARLSVRQGEALPVGDGAASAAVNKILGRMIYGILCFAILFSFVGTVLGGIWADQSWGRFWGWDPKENGAVLIVLWNAVILHARWSGIARERGLACLAIVGNIVTAWSWFGTNMLGVGLHTYGFMDSALFWLGFFLFSQLFFIALGLLPAQGPGGPAGRGFPLTVKSG